MFGFSRSRASIKPQIDEGELELHLNKFFSAKNEAESRSARIDLAQFGLNHIESHPVRAASAMAFALEGLGSSDNNNVRGVLTRDVAVVYCPNDVPVVAFPDGEWFSVVVLGQKIMNRDSLDGITSQLLARFNDIVSTLGVVDYIANATLPAVKLRL